MLAAGACDLPSRRASTASAAWSVCTSVHVKYPASSLRQPKELVCCKQDFGEPLEGNAEAEAYGADGGEDAGPGPGNASEDLGEDVHQEFVEDAASAGKQQPAAGAAPGAQAGVAGAGAAGGAAIPQPAASAEGGAPQNGSGRPQVPFSFHLRARR